VALQDDIQADQAAIAAAQQALDAANASLADHQRQMEALAPHQGVLAEIEAKAAQYGDAAVAEFSALTARLKALLGL
jgi:hypothetical protein